MTDSQAAKIDSVLSDWQRHAEAVIDASYGTSIDSRDSRYHDIRYDLKKTKEARAALQLLRERLAGYPTAEAEPDKTDCVCHLMHGETCAACNAKFETDVAP